MHSITHILIYAIPTGVSRASDITEITFFTYLLPAINYMKKACIRQWIFFFFSLLIHLDQYRLCLAPTDPGFDPRHCSV